MTARDRVANCAKYARVCFLDFRVLLWQAELALQRKGF
jgi:hypothetical protein